VDESDADRFRSEAERCRHLAEKALKKADREAWVQLADNWSIMPLTQKNSRVSSMNELKQKFDAPTVAVMRQALNEVVADRRFQIRKSVSQLEMAEHILQQAASGVRDLGGLKSAAFAKLRTAA
jgi:hypothetical protein